MKYNLEFTNYDFGSGYIRKVAVYFFPNGYGVSVINISHPNGHNLSYTDNNTQYEVAILIGAIDDYEIAYNDENVEEEVIGYLCIDDVYDIMEEVKTFKKPETKN